MSHFIRKPAGHTSLISLGWPARITAILVRTLVGLVVVGNGPIWAAANTAELDQAIRRHDENLRKLEEHIKQAGEKSRAYRDQIDALEREKLNALADLTLGLFCSECGRSKTEIEKAGLSFADHLREVKGKPVKAPEGMLRDKEAAYNQKISNLRGHLQSTERQSGEWRDAVRNAQRARSEAEADRRKAIEDAEQLERDQREKQRRDREQQSEEQRKAREQQRERDQAAREDARQKREQGFEARREAREQEQRAAQDAGQKKAAAANAALAAETERLANERQAAVERMRNFKNQELPKLDQETHGYTEQGKNDATKSQIGGSLKVLSGAGRAATEFAPEPEKQFIRRLRGEVDRQNDQSKPVALPGKVGGVVNGAIEVYQGAQQIHEGAREKTRLERIEAGNNQIFQTISNRMERHIRTEEDLIHRLREEAKGLREAPSNQAIPVSKP